MAVATASFTLSLAILATGLTGAAGNPVSVTASATDLSSSGGSVTISAKVKNGKTCAWTSRPKVKAFDGSVPCKAELSRVAKVPANTTMCVKPFKFSLDATIGKLNASGSVIVTEAGTMRMVCTK